MASFKHTIDNRTFFELEVKLTESEKELRVVDKHIQELTEGLNQTLLQMHVLTRSVTRFTRKCRSGSRRLTVVGN